MAIEFPEGDIHIDLNKVKKYEIFIEFITRGGVKFQLPLNVDI